MDKLYLNKETLLQFIDNCRIVNSKINSLLLDAKQIKKDLHTTKVNYGFEHCILDNLEWDAEKLLESDAEEFFKERLKISSSMEKGMESLLDDMSRLMDWMDNMSEKLSSITKKAKKLRDSGLYESLYLKRYSNRDEIEKLKKEREDEYTKRSLERYYKEHPEKRPKE